MVTTIPAASATGRPRDAAIDAAVLSSTLTHLARDGITGMSIAAIAHDAGTTRPAIYRRWPTKVDLVVAAIAHLASVAPPVPQADPYPDLVAEMDHFRHCISAPGALSLAGLMLGTGVENPVRERYLREVVAPRRTRIRASLEAAAQRHLIDPDADLSLAASMLTGSWYAAAVAHVIPTADWPDRIVAQVWRSCGGRAESIRTADA